MSPRRSPEWIPFRRRNPSVAVMNIESLIRDPAGVEADWLAVGVFDGQTDPPAALRGTSASDLLGPLLAAGELPGSLGETTPVFGASGLAARSLLVFGLGKRDAFGPGEAYAAGVAVARRLASKPRGRVAVVLPDAGAVRDVAPALTEGLVVGTRGPDLRKTVSDRHSFDSLLIVAVPGQFADNALAAGVQAGGVIGEAVNLARDLANTPPAEKPPARLAARARELAIASGVSAEVWDLERIRQERFGGLLGVASGSDEPPAFVVLQYLQGGDAPTLALVGKGITFDSGGLSLKPSTSMEDMKSDMTGAAVVLATLCAAARLELPVNLRGYLALAENMTGGRALKLGDVLTLRNGKTVEIMNTDAEGRLVLADALSYAVEARPDRLLDLATLTGACMVALGQKVAGLFATDDAFAHDVLEACKKTGERAWRLPLDDDYREGLKSLVADMKNVGSKWGGAITAAKFLQSFVGETPWVHLDIAGPSWNDAEGSTRDAGGTGCFVRTLLRLLDPRLGGGTG
jgi:leucyl aminopeptidase